MITIPQNTEDKFNAQCEALTKLVLNDLSKGSRSDIYHSNIPSLAVAEAVGKAFVDKGYYAKITYFVESWKGFQKLSVSKSPMAEVNARMVYDRFI